MSEIPAQKFNNNMPSKVFETTAMQFHHQFATRVRNMLTELEFYIFIYKDLKMFYWVSTTGL